MQVLCKPSENAADVRCLICGEGFVVYWERTSKSEQGQTISVIQQTLIEHHTSAAGDETRPHPQGPFNIPSWGGLPSFSGAALLGGFYETPR